MTQREKIEKVLYDLVCDYNSGGSVGSLEEEVTQIETLITEARLDERNELALDNYRGQTFSDSTNYEAKFAKFIDNNNKRISRLQASLKGKEV